MSSVQDNIPSDSNAVYTGFWIDWDRGKILGATLTLRDSHAVPLLAALAILVTLAGNRSWHICRLVWHVLLRSKESHKEAVQEHRRKQQVVIRNSETAGGATLSLVEEWFSFGILKLLRECATKDILAGSFAAGHCALFIALGVLVSQIVLGNVVVSKKLPTCGEWIPSIIVDTGKINFESDLVFNELQLNKTINSDNYVRSCYPLGGSEGRVDCNKFMMTSVSHVLKDNETCPFEPTACYPDTSSAITLESENMTFSQLGLNTKYGKDISIQRQSTCAVLDAEVFKVRGYDDRNGTTCASICEGTADTALYSFYKEEETGENATFPFTLRNQFADDYKLMSIWLIFDPEHIAQPIRPKSDTSNEVSIFILQGLGIVFVEEHDDYWFSAHAEVEYDNSTGVVPEGYRRYRMDAFLNMISCTEQYRFCSSITDQCTEFQGLLRNENLSNRPLAYTTLFGAKGPEVNLSGASDFNLAVMLIESIMKESAIPGSIGQRGQAALQASRFLRQSEQLRLRPDQWKFELEYWFMSALARLQLAIIETIDRPINLDETRAKNAWGGANSALLNLCGRIKFRSSNHTSLSTFGLIMILVFSGVLMLGSVFGMGLYAVPWTKRWRIVVEWERDGVLSLLQLTEQNISEVQDSNADCTFVPVGEKIHATSEEEVENDSFDPFLMSH